MFGNKPNLSSIGQLIVECNDNTIRVTSGYMRIDTIIEEIGFANVYDTISGNTLLVSKDENGNLVKADGNYWPDNNDDLTDATNSGDDDPDPELFKN